MLLSSDAHSEYLPPGNAAKLLERWTDLLNPKAFQARVLAEANHQAASPEATAELVDAVKAFLAPLSTHT